MAEYDMQANGNNGVSVRTNIVVLPTWDGNQKGVLLVGGDAQAALPNTDIVGIVATGNQNGTGMLTKGGALGPGVVGLAGMNGFDPRSNNPHDFLVHQFGVFGFAGTDGNVNGNPNTQCGVYGESQGQGHGVHGFSRTGVGVFGETVPGFGDPRTGIGVSGTGPTKGVDGSSVSGIGVAGDGFTKGVDGSSATGIGVAGAGLTLGVDGSPTSKVGDGVHGSHALRK